MSRRVTVGRRSRREAIGTSRPAIPSVAIASDVRTTKGPLTVGAGTALAPTSPLTVGRSPRSDPASEGKEDDTIDSARGVTVADAD